MCVKYIRDNNLQDCIIYILACRIGPFLNFYKEELSKVGIKVFVNPDGHEWKRSKWNRFVKYYWKLSEKLMVKNADLLICDSIGIENYIRQEYKKYKPNTTFIAYGANLKKSNLGDNAPILTKWYTKFNIQKNRYYLIVGRFVPENNFETMLMEFMNSKSQNDLVIVTNHEGTKLYNELFKKLNFDRDKRIKFVGTVYNQELLKKIRENAFCYIHGHEVGGTNPSLLESLASTNLNILFDVIFNREVGKDAALYFTKEPGSLSRLINRVDKFETANIEDYSARAKERIYTGYSWERIIQKYESIFSY